MEAKVVGKAGVVMAVVPIYYRMVAKVVMAE
jgi:hypothetical protein